MKETLEMGAAVQADPSVSDCAEPVLTSRKDLKHRMRDRQDAEDEFLLMRGKVVGAEIMTDVQLVTFGEKLAGHLAKPGQPGAFAPEFTRIFDDRTVASFLPEARSERTTVLAEFRKRLTEAPTSSEIRKMAADLVKAVDDEMVAVKREDDARESFEKAQEKEIVAKVSAVIADRACRNLVKSKLAADLPRVRRLLGLGNPGNRRSKAEEARRKAAEAKRLAEIAKKAAEAAARAEQEAQQAALEAEAEAQAKAAAKAKKKKGKAGEVVP